ncbi:hypothetical protein BGW36DRAFT_309159 [Talaromyces proteolyticus]|uniref:Geranylgeranyl pyrophosphate synthetase n=1 Tax=Talaromyces proteolyticus TaxID=1131652 RepID=A0AAD4KDF0_9EURO|nr:uncharacterized protein BGW36DRAFT_309159 [Talaromyces proteolyticus]KAH8689077.1 hypothetical protein BGW36DRAFT_309159 [Talaromyces proteolyticus]
MDPRINSTQAKLSSRRPFPPRWQKIEATKKRPETPAPSKGQLLFEIDRSELKLPGSVDCDGDPRITACTDLASYTWLNKANPTIIVPGEPPVWNPPAGSRQLKGDRGDYLRDPNAAKYPTYPMEPAIQAILHENPGFNGQKINIVTCSSTLGNISRFVRGVHKDFRFIMDKVGSTIFFLRRENSPTELIPDVRGYGHNFLDEYTSWDRGVRGSESHQRVIRYEFGGFHFVIRFEADGYIVKKDTDIEERDGNSDVKDLIDLMKVETSARKTDDLTVEKGGRRIMMKDIVDIKTRARYTNTNPPTIKEIDWTDITPRLWISQIPTVIVGYHKFGHFEDIDIKPMKNMISQWEKENENSLRKLASLLHELVESALTSRTRLEICREGSGPLEVRRVCDCNMEALPVGLKERWAKV